MPSRILFWLALLPVAARPLRAAEYFVSPEGNDAGPGTAAWPFATLDRAQKPLRPGDTVTIRGGTYRLTEEQTARHTRLYASVIHLDRSGTREAPITFRAAPGTQPVFDFTAVKPAGLRVAAFHITGSWLRLEGLEVTGVQVTLKRHTQSICFYSEGSHNRLERLRMHDNQAIGIYSVRGADNLYLNCDAWRNHDFTSEDGRGGNVDGFGCHPEKGATGNIFRGCRAWLNSDDGFDLISAMEPVRIENCWAFRNGRAADGRRLADGNGFKAGGYGSREAGQLPRPVPRHTVSRCLAADNPAAGFYANHHPGGIDWLYNTAFRNGTNYNFLGRLPDNTTDVPGSGHRMEHNAGTGSRRPVAHLDAAQCAATGNVFDAPGSSFSSLDAAELERPRRPDGSLPAIRFLHPQPDSPARHAGAFAE